MTTHELLDQWREATRAAELAERLAKVAAEGIDRADQAAAAAQDIAALAESAARSAEAAARSARAAADRATALAQEARDGTLTGAQESVVDTRADEAAALDRYHEAEREAQERQRS